MQHSQETRYSHKIKTRCVGFNPSAIPRPHTCSSFVIGNEGWSSHQEEKDCKLASRPASGRVRQPHGTAVERLGRSLHTAAAGKCKSQQQIQSVSETLPYQGSPAKKTCTLKKNGFQMEKDARCLRQWKGEPNQSRPGKPESLTYLNDSHLLYKELVVAGLSPVSLTTQDYVRNVLSRLRTVVNPQLTKAHASKQGHL